MSEYVVSDELAEAVQYAQEFLRRYDLWRQAVAGEPGTHPRESASLRRASMDLTRALAEYRKNGPQQWRST